MMVLLRAVGAQSSDSYRQPPVVVGVAVVAVVGVCGDCGVFVVLGGQER
jgi:hypothetical protein